jgi:hypothetical protein
MTEKYTPEELHDMQVKEDWRASDREELVNRLKIASQSAFNVFGIKLYLREIADSSVLSHTDFGNRQKLVAIMDSDDCNEPFKDIIGVLDLFRPFELEMMRGKTNRTQLHEVFTALDEYYDWCNANYRNRSSVWDQFNYRMSLLLSSGVSLHRALKVFGEEDPRLFHLVEFFEPYNDPDKSFTDILVEVKTEKATTMLFEAAESNRELARLFRSLVDAKFHVYQTHG